MAKRLDIEYVKDLVREIAGYTLLDNVYINNNTKMTAVDKDGYKYYFTLSNLKYAKSARMVDKSNPYSIDNIKLWLKNHDIPYELLSTEYNGNGSKNRNKQLLKLRCDNGHIFYRTWNDIRTDGVRCEDCARRYVNKEQFLSFISDKYGDEYEIIGEYVNSQTKIQIKHNKCGNVFYATPNSLANGHGCPNSFCCKKRGEDHYRYNKNLSDEERYSDRKSKKEYRYWRSSVYAAYNFTCDVCGHKSSKDNKIVAHHIESYDINEDLRYDISNGVALCESCHRGFHHKFGYGHNTREQYEQYKDNYDNTEVIHQIA